MPSALVIVVQTFNIVQASALDSLANEVIARTSCGDGERGIDSDHRLCVVPRGASDAGLGKEQMVRCWEGRAADPRVGRGSARTKAIGRLPRAVARGRSLRCPTQCQ